MAKRNSTRRKARKPKFIEIDGHQLTEAMKADFDHCVDKRYGETGGRLSVPQIEELALGDFLADYRPSRKIRRQLAVLSQMAMSTSLAFGQMRDYSFCPTEPASIRSSGCKLLREMERELSSIARTLSALATGIEAENDMKVQGWLAQARFLEELGCSKEFAHGNC